MKHSCTDRMAIPISSKSRVPAPGNENRTPHPLHGLRTSVYCRLMTSYRPRWRDDCRSLFVCRLAAPSMLQHAVHLLVSSVYPSSSRAQKKRPAGRLSLWCRRFRRWPFQMASKDLWILAITLWTCRFVPSATSGLCPSEGRRKVNSPSCIVRRASGPAGS